MKVLRMLQNLYFTTLNNFRVRREEAFFFYFIEPNAKEKYFKIKYQYFPTIILHTIQNRIISMYF